MVAKLELARLQQASIKDGHFDYLAADPVYRTLPRLQPARERA